MLCKNQFINSSDKPRSRCYDSPHFAEEKSEAQRGETPCPRRYHREVAEAGTIAGGLLTALLSFKRGEEGGACDRVVPKRQALGYHDEASFTGREASLWRSRRYRAGGWRITGSQKRFSSFVQQQTFTVCARLHANRWGHTEQASELVSAAGADSYR